MVPKYKSLVQGVADIYARKIKPVEEYFQYPIFFTPSLSEAEILAKPMVLLLGQYSTGKTTFIRRILGEIYPGSHIGPEPTTDKFVAVMHGPDARVIPGNAAVAQTEKPFHTLSQHGSSFLSKFQISHSHNALLESVSFVDTPGVLSGEKQRLGRSYDFAKVFPEHLNPYRSVSGLPKNPTLSFCCLMRTNWTFQMNSRELSLP